MNSPRVILVVDRNYGEKLHGLPADVPVWVIDSAHNRAAVEPRRVLAGDSTTCFRGHPESSPAELVAAIISTIETHHGDDSQDPAFERLTIIGALSGASVESCLAEFGFFGGSGGTDVIEYARKNG